MKRKFSIARLLIRVFMTAYTLVVILPVVWMIYTSFKTSAEFMQNPWMLPGSLHLQNYVNAWTRGSLGLYALNSLLVVGVTLAVLVFLTACTSYVLARFPFRGSSLIENVYMGSLLLPSIVALTPIFLTMKDLRLNDTRTGLIIVLTAALLPFSVFIMVSFFRTIPREFEDAAFIDGCSYFRTFWSVMVPLARSGIVTVLIFNFIFAWNDYAFSLVLVTSESKKTIQLGLIYLSEVQRYSTDWGALFAGLVLVTVPLILVYSFFQNKITSGLAAGGLKG